MFGYLGYRAKGKPLGGQGEALCTRGTQGRPPPILLAVFPEVYHTLHPSYPKPPTLSRPMLQIQVRLLDVIISTVLEGFYVTISFDLFNCLLLIYKHII